MKSEKSLKWISRREFLAGAAAATAVSSPAMAWAQSGERLKSPFRLSVITDEISPDFERACSIAANEFHLNWVEIRNLWGKTLLDLDAGQIAEAQAILSKYKLRVTDYASPLFKVDWKGAPVSKFSPKRDNFGGSKEFDQQDEVLERCIALAKTFKADKVRCFDFWRLDDPKPYREAINAKLRAAAERLNKEGLLLVLENEPACNTATGADAAAVLAAVPNKNFRLNWDPGNAGMVGIARPFPDDYAHIPFDRIAHCHCKDVGPKAGGGYEWRPVGKGTMDWVGQFRAFKKAGYRGAVSMETHWKGGGSPEESTRISIAGMFDALRKADCLTA